MKFNNKVNPGISGSNYTVDDNSNKELDCSIASQVNYFPYSVRVPDRSIPAAMGAPPTENAFKDGGQIMQYQGDVIHVSSENSPRTIQSNDGNVKSNFPMFLGCSTDNYTIIEPRESKAKDSVIEFSESTIHTVMDKNAMSDSPEHDIVDVLLGQGHGNVSISDSGVLLNTQGFIDAGLNVNSSSGNNSVDISSNMSTLRPGNSSDVCAGGSQKKNISYECQYCFMGFIHLPDYKQHITEHDLLNNYKCPHCKEIFHDHILLNIHVNSHLKERPFPCHFCGKRFRRRKLLDCHQHVHTGVKNFLCGTCGKSFTTEGNFTRHKLIHMARVNHYKCKTCGKVFDLKANLQSHYRYHNAIKPYVCYICDRGFKTRTHLKNHFDTHSK